MSKFLSFVLRHKPDAIDLELDQHGWANINELIDKGIASGDISSLSFELVQQVVETSDKKRFIISDDGSRIRANQGHSINVDLQLKPVILKIKARLMYESGFQFYVSENGV